MRAVLVLTRPPDASARFAAELGYDGPSVMSPALRIEEVPFERPETPDQVIFTSARGVSATKQLNWPTMTAWCVGARTAETARAAGFNAIDGGGTASALVRTIIKAAPKGRILHLRGAHARGDVAARLQKAGLNAEDLVVYDQVPEPPNAALLELAKGAAPLVFPLFSPRSCLILGDLKATAPIHVAAMSDAVAHAAEPYAPASVVIARTPDQAGICAATKAVLARVNQHGQ